jgi:TolB-like protein
MKKLLFAVLIFMMCAYYAFAQRPTLGVLRIIGNVTENDGELLSRELMGQRVLLNKFDVVPRNLSRDVISEELGNQVELSRFTDPNTMTRIGKLLNADYILFGELMQFAGKNFLCTLIFRVDTFELIAGHFLAFKEMEEILDLLPHVAAELTNTATRQRTVEAPSLAILPFSHHNGVDSNDAVILTKMFCIELLSLGVYRVIPRISIFKTIIFREIETQNSARNDMASMMSLGQALNAKYVIGGSISNFGSKNLVIAEIHNVETGVVLAGGSVQYAHLMDSIHKMKDLVELLNDVSVEIESIRENSIAANRSAQQASSILRNAERILNTANTESRTAREQVRITEAASEQAQLAEAAAIDARNAYSIVFTQTENARVAAETAANKLLQAERNSTASGRTIVREAAYSAARSAQEAISAAASAQQALNNLNAALDRVKVAATEATRIAGKTRDLAAELAAADAAAHQARADAQTAETSAQIAAAAAAEAERMSARRIAPARVGEVAVTARTAANRAREAASVASQHAKESESAAYTARITQNIITAGKAVACAAQAATNLQVAKTQTEDAVNSQRLIQRIVHYENARRQEARFWSTGLAVGTTFTQSWVTVTPQITLAPLRYSFLRVGSDFGFVRGTENTDYFLLHPFAHYNLFLPFGRSGGWYIGGGGGVMWEKSRFSDFDFTMDNGMIPSVDFSTGFILGNRIEISYTIRVIDMSADFPFLKFSSLPIQKISLGFTQRLFLPKKN